MSTTATETMVEVPTSWFSVRAHLDPFHQLVQDLSAELGPTSGLDAAEVDHVKLQQIMEEYTSDITDWRKYALADKSRPYTRNLVDRGNGKSNLLILVWTPGKGSPIHDHANSHCVMKILHGRLQETLYDWPDKSLVADGVECPPQVKKDSIYTENEVTYMSDKIGLHRVINPDPNEFAVSLHLYTPPHAANHGCHIFDEKTGKPSHVPGCTLYSEHGSKL